MKLWHWIILVVIGAMLGVSVWVLYWRPTHPAARVPAAVLLGAPMHVAPAGQYEQEDFDLWALCIDPRHDLVYLAEGRGGLSAAPSIVVIPGGCAHPAGSAAPAPRK